MLSAVRRAGAAAPSTRRQEAFFSKISLSLAPGPVAWGRLSVSIADARRGRGIQIISSNGCRCGYDSEDDGEHQHEDGGAGAVGPPPALDYTRPPAPEQAKTRSQTGVTGRTQFFFYGTSSESEEGGDDRSDEQQSANAFRRKDSSEEELLGGPVREESPTFTSSDQLPPPLCGLLFYPEGPPSGSSRGEAGALPDTPNEPDESVDEPPRPRGPQTTRGVLFTDFVRDAELLSQHSLRETIQYTETRVHNAPLWLAAKLETTFPPLRPLAGLVRMVDLDIPVCLVLAAAALAVHYKTTHSDKLGYFTMYPRGHFEPTDLRNVFRVFGQVLGHSDREHLTNNLTNLFLVGPVCEHDLGAYNFLRVIFWVCLLTAGAHLALGAENVGLLGMSGLIYGLIMLNSLIHLKTGRIPVGFLVQVAIWAPSSVDLKNMFLRMGGTPALGREDEHYTSQLAHIVGGMVGAGLGYHFHNERMHETIAKIVQAWRTKAGHGRKEEPLREKTA